MEEFEAEQASKPASKCRKRVPKSDIAQQKRRVNLKGGIDWYRYRTYVLLPKLLPYSEINQEYGECFLTGNGLSPPWARGNREDDELQGLT